MSGVALAFAVGRDGRAKHGSDLPEELEAISQEMEELQMKLLSLRSIQDCGVEGKGRRSPEQDASLVSCSISYSV